MRYSLIPPLIALLAAALPRAAAQTVPIADFTREATYQDVQISPDGQFVGFIAAVGENQLHHVLVMMDLATRKMKTFDAPIVAYDTDNTEEVRGFNWITEKRVLFSYGRTDDWDTLSGMGAVDRDGGNWKDLLGMGGLFYIPGHEDDFLVERAASGVTRDHPMVYRIDAEPSRSIAIPQARAEVTRKTWHEITDDGQGMTGWIPDRDGRIRVGVAFDGETTRVIYRPTEDADWVALKDFDAQGLGGYPMAIDWDGRTAYTAVLGATGTWGVGTYDLVTHQRGPIVAADPRYDIVSPTDLLASQSRFLFSYGRRRLIGVRYPAEVERTRWVDPDMAQLQASLDHALPGRMNTITSWSDDDTRFIISSWSDRHPATFYFYDRSSHSLGKLFDSAPWIKPELLARSFPLSYRARDGLLIHGYVTFPLGSAQKNLPLVVLANPGLILARTVLGYNAFVQFLANRGYAVLQINPRGSPGYGEPFFDAGRCQAGRRMQDDVTDAVRWAIARGFADPRRIGIVGDSLGGYTATWALASTPGLFRCGVTYRGICDWPVLFNAFDIGGSVFKSAGYSQNSELLKYLETEVGDPKRDKAELSEISPDLHADRIKAPLLIVTYDSSVENLIDQSSRLASALKSAGAPYQYEVLARVKSNLVVQQDNERYFKLVGDFLAKNLN